MRKLTTIESRYWIDSFPSDLAIACAVAVCCMGATALISYHCAMHFFTTHHTVQVREQRPAAIFLSSLLTIINGAATAALTLAVRLFQRMYRNPL